MPNTIAYVFPGQGSQSVGMGADIYKSSPAAKRVFDEADEVLNASLSKLCFEGSEDELRQTVNAQPALLTTSVATLAAMQEAIDGKPLPVARFMAGHSVGEYAALLERHGLSVTDAHLFDRPTPLEGGGRGLRDWILMFAYHLLEDLPAGGREEVLRRTEDRLRPVRFDEGTWVVDYRRLRVVAIKE